MLAGRTEAIDKVRQVLDRDRHVDVVGLVLGGAPALGQDARSGEDLAGRIMRLASMAAVLHMAQSAAQQRSPASPCDDLVPAGCLEAPR